MTTRVDRRSGGGCIGCNCDPCCCEQGATGATGATGSSGATGATGSSGTTGATGATGAGANITAANKQVLWNNAGVVAGVEGRTREAVGRVNRDPTVTYDTIGAVGDTFPTIGDRRLSQAADGVYQDLDTWHAPDATGGPAVDIPLSRTRVLAGVTEHYTGGDPVDPTKTVNTEYTMGQRHNVQNACTTRYNMEGTVVGPNGKLQEDRTGGIQFNDALPHLLWDSTQGPLGTANAAPITNNCTVDVEAHVQLFKDDGTRGAKLWITGSYRVTGGVYNAIVASVDVVAPQRDDPSYTAAFSIPGGAGPIQLLVTGDGGLTRATGRVSVQVCT